MVIRTDYTEAYSKPFKTSKLECFTKIVNSFLQLSVFSKYISKKAKNVVQIAKLKRVSKREKMRPITKLPLLKASHTLSC